MEGFCRGCLIKYDEPTDLLQYTEKNRRLYVYSTGLQAKRNDTFPFQLCKECYMNMKQSCKFKKQCRTSDKRFKNYLALKEAGDVNDFCAFLKNIDDSLMFRFPLRSGNSTPTYQKPRDDDEESTCTSIRNFMTDIIQADEIPDTEARIIREVIEEEADVMEDSLDSHWLQDDASIDTDFRLDFSFSPFTTPQSVNNDRCYTPQKLRELVKKVQIIGKRENTESDQPESSGQNKVLAAVEVNAEQNLKDSIVNKNEIAIKNHEKNYMIQQNFKLNVTNSSMSKNYIAKNTENYVRQQNFYVEIDQLNKEHVEKNVLQITGNKDCTIEKNLEAALNENDKEYLLEDILKTPRIFPGASGASTPTINNILFGDKLDENPVAQTPRIILNATAASTPTINNILFGDRTDENPVSQTPRSASGASTITINNISLNDKIDKNPVSGASTPTINKILFGDNVDENGISSPNPGHYIEKYEAVEGDIDLLNDFLQDHNQSFNLYHVTTDENCQRSENVENKSNNEPKDEEPKYDLINAICKICDRKFQAPKSLRIHFIKKHNIHLQKKPPKACKQKIKICDTCGKKFGDFRNLIKHIKTHENEGLYTCKICTLKFTSLSKLHTHKQTHIDPVTKQKLAASREHRYVCSVCGAGVASLTNLRIHLQRHYKTFVCYCSECGRGFYRKNDLKVHMRTHNNDRPCGCEVCGKKFSRTDTLNRHMKIHNDERHYKCKVCGKGFTQPSALTYHMKKSLKCLQLRLHDEIIKQDMIDKRRRNTNTFYSIVDDDDPKLIIEEVNDVDPVLAEPGEEDVEM